MPQWESLAGLTEEPTLPSFLYLPEEAAAAYFRGREVGAGQWVVGRFARIKASETPGRVVYSAKSWLCHHAADRSAAFLPWGSTDLARERKISPVRASALILNYLRGTWNNRFAQAGFAFDDQEITVTGARRPVLLRCRGKPIQLLGARSWPIRRLSRRAQLLSIRAVTFSTWYRAADKQSVMGSASVERDLGGRVRLPFTTNRNGQIGTLPPKCCSGSPNSDNT